MKKNILKLSILAAVAVAGLTGCGKSSESAMVTTDGSTSMEKVIGTLSESYMEQNPSVQVSYNPTGSGSGITAVLNGTCDIGLSSRNLKEEEASQGLEQTILAKDGISVIVNTQNKVTDLTMEQIADIYMGNIKNWSEVGGEDGEIVVIGREAGSGTRDGFEAVTKTEEKCVLRQELTSTGDVIATVKNNENAIGYASFASVDETVQTMAISGVKPDQNTIQDGSYVLQRPFVLVTKKDQKLSKEAQKFFDYMISAEAREIVKRAGVVPAE